MSIVEDPNDILSIDDRQDKIIHVKEWKKDIKIKSLSAGAVTKIEQRSTDKRGNLNNEEWLTRLVVYGVVKDDGTQVFQEAHMKALANMSVSAIKFIAGEIVSLNDLDISETEIAKK